MWSSVVFSSRRSRRRRSSSRSFSFGGTLFRSGGAFAPKISCEWRTMTNYSLCMCRLKKQTYGWPEGLSSNSESKSKWFYDEFDECVFDFVYLLDFDQRHSERHFPRLLRSCCWEWNHRRNQFISVTIIPTWFALVQSVDWFPVNWKLDTLVQVHDNDSLAPSPTSYKTGVWIIPRTSRHSAEAPITRTSSVNARRKSSIRLWYISSRCFKDSIFSSGRGLVPEALSEMDFCVLSITCSNCRARLSRSSKILSFVYNKSKDIQKGVRSRRSQYRVCLFWRWWVFSQSEWHRPKPSAPLEQRRISLVPATLNTRVDL